MQENKRNQCEPPSLFPGKNEGSCVEGTFAFWVPSQPPHPSFSGPSCRRFTGAWAPPDGASLISEHPQQCGGHSGAPGRSGELACTWPLRSSRSFLRLQSPLWWEAGPKSKSGLLLLNHNNLRGDKWPLIYPSPQGKGLFFFPSFSLTRPC